ncbi:alpha/beta fold hydrolase [Desulfosarcina cetonica]|uniref:alpha/beta fold hydrolase n=1 Tax=Desulfosarcina cetonica TaxID=90730 RepID=UPI0006D03717|nr:alpha/beta hydrolase [Desulfosarcina cetonica]
MRARLIVRTWPEILDAAGLEVLVSAVLPQVFGEAFLMRNRKHIDRIAKAIVRRNPQDALAAHLLAMKDYPRLRSMLAKLEMPSLVISGSDDPLVSVDGAEEVAEKSGGRHLVAKGVGHSIAAEAPEWFLETVSRFLADRWTDMPEGL